MSSRLLTLLLLAGFFSCQSPYNNSPGSSGMSPEAEETLKIRERQAFQAFIDQLSQNPFISPDHQLQQLARQYFPDSTIHKDHSLHARLIPFQKKRHLVYYEYSMESPTVNNVYLGVFSEEGEALDLLKIKEVSFDGSITVKLIDEKILELEYYDFFHSRELFKSEIYTEESTKGTETPFSLKTSYRPVSGDSEIVDYYYYENYTFKPDGSLKLLDRADEILVDRKYPFVSLRVLSYSELEQYKSRELRAMINEIYASYGYIFRNEQLLRKYRRQVWYEPRHANVDTLLSSVERLNIKKLAEMEIRNQ